jgi:N-acetylglucosamine-6-sulfatase
MPVTRALLLIGVLLGLVLPASAAAARPNVVVIETDDQTVADLASMPETQRLIGDRGVSFSNSFVSLSQCCPSRATLLTGQYAHNHGVHTTEPPFGGFPAFHDSESLAVWLRRAGYETALVGKYMNGYGKDDPTYVPPGWTYWHGLLGPSTYDFTSFGANENGHVRRYRGRYKTDVVAARSEEFVRRTAAAGHPFFLWATYVAPHIGNPRDLLLPRRYEATVPSPLFANAFLGAPMPLTPAFDEPDVSDKPAGIRRRPHLGPAARSVLETLWRRRQQSLLSVDNAVRRMVDTLKGAGVLENTLLVFTSDNGFLLGEHRVRESKVLPYEASIRVPLLMRGPGVPRGATRSQLVWNGDLAPTILQATGASAAWPADGMSLLPFARDASARSGRDILLEGPPVNHAQDTPKFTGVHTADHVYVEYATGEVELYDLRRDPYELRNLAGTPAAAPLQRTLAARLARLRDCVGAACRAR